MKQIDFTIEQIMLMALQYINREVISNTHIDISRSAMMELRELSKSTKLDKVIKEETDFNADKIEELEIWALTQIQNSLRYNNIDIDNMHVNKVVDNMLTMIFVTLDEEFKDNPENMLLLNTIKLMYGQVQHENS